MSFGVKECGSPQDGQAAVGTAISHDSRVRLSINICVNLMKMKAYNGIGGKSGAHGGAAWPRVSEAAADELRISKPSMRRRKSSVF